MSTALVWGGVTLILGLVMFGCIYRIAKLRLVTPDQVKLLRERNEAELSRRTMDNQASLRNAELAKQVAEAEQTTKLVGALEEDRLESERRILEARTKAEEDLAGEFARARHEACLARGDVVARYAELMQVLDASRSGAYKMEFDDFVETLQDGGILPSDAS